MEFISILIIIHDGLASVQPYPLLMLVCLREIKNFLFLYLFFKFKHVRSFSFTRVNKLQNTYI